MKATLICIIALLGLVHSRTVYVSDSEVRSSVTGAGSVTRGWRIRQDGPMVSSLGWQSTGNPNEQNEGQPSSPTTTVAWVFSSAFQNAPFYLQWGLFQGDSLGGGKSASLSGTSVGSAFAVHGYVVYTDANGNGEYDQGEETSVNKFENGGAQGTSVTVGNATVSSNNDTTKPVTFLVTSTNGDGSAVFRYLLSNQDVTSQGEYNEATSAKLDIFFKPSYSPGDAENAKVALITTFAAVQVSVKVGGSAKIGGKGAKGKGSLSYSVDGKETTLQWSPTAAALVNDTQVDAALTSRVVPFDVSAGFTLKAGTYVNGKQLKNNENLGQNAFKKADYKGEANLLFFNFNVTRPSELYWDPSVGGSSASSGSSVFASVAVIVVSVVLVLF